MYRGLCENAGCANKPGVTLSGPHCIVMRMCLHCRSPSTLGTDFQPEHFEDDLWYIVALSTCREILDESWLDFSVRGMLWSNFMEEEC